MTVLTMLHPPTHFGTTNLHSTNNLFDNYLVYEQAVVASYFALSMVLYCKGYDG